MRRVIKKSSTLIEVNRRSTEPAAARGVIPYEARLSADSNWALYEGSVYFEGKGSVRAALKKIANRLHELDIAYAVVGGLALFQHGYRRFTADVDLVVPLGALKKIHQELVGMDYLPDFNGSKHLRDIELGVKIEFIIAGQFPGDGKPKPVAFPNPEGASFSADGIQFIKLPQLIELKLASGMTNRGRQKDLGDVQELVKFLKLPETYADELNPYVRDQFTDLWRGAHTRYDSETPHDEAR